VSDNGFEFRRSRSSAASDIDHRVGEWFRNETWDDAARTEFFRRLARSRDKSQHLFIQAAHLLDTRPAIALELCDFIIEQHPERFAPVLAHDLRSRALERLGRVDEAIEAARRALDAQRAFPNIRPGCERWFGLLCVRHGRVEHYGEALRALDSEAPNEEDTSHAPKVRFEILAVRALIAEHLREQQRARDYARRALAAAALDRSDFAKHPQFGLASADEALITHLRAITSERR